MTEMLEQLGFICVGIAFVVLMVAMMVYFVVGHPLQAFTCLFAIAFLGATMFREVRLRRDLSSSPQ